MRLVSGHEYPFRMATFRKERQEIPLPTTGETIEAAFRLHNPVVRAVQYLRNRGGQAV